MVCMDITNRLGLFWKGGGDSGVVVVCQGQTWEDLLSSLLLAVYRLIIVDPKITLGMHKRGMAWYIIHK